jgi:hypothetical protein
MFFAVLCLMPSTSQADETRPLLNQDIQSYIESLNRYDIEQNNKGFDTITVDTNTLIQTFCASVLDTGLNEHNFFQQNTVAQTAYFDATQSLFLYVLCSP